MLFIFITQIIFSTFFPLFLTYIRLGVKYLNIDKYKVVQGNKNPLVSLLRSHNKLLNLKRSIIRGGTKSISLLQIHNKVFVKSLWRNLRILALPGLLLLITAGKLDCILGFCADQNSTMHWVFVSCIVMLWRLTFFSKFQFINVLTEDYRKSAIAAVYVDQMRNDEEDSPFSPSYLNHFSTIESQLYAFMCTLKISIESKGGSMPYVSRDVMYPSFRRNATYAGLHTRTYIVLKDIAALFTALHRDYGLLKNGRLRRVISAENVWGRLMMLYTTTMHALIKQ